MVDTLTFQKKQRIYSTENGEQEEERRERERPKIKEKQTI